MPSADPPRVEAAFVPADAMSAALRRTLLIGALLLTLMSGFRVAFVLRYAHPEIWRDFLGDLPAAFGLGVLHDLRITLLFLLPLMLSLLWMRAAARERWERWIRRARRWCFLGITGLITLLVSDFVFYSYYQSHFSVLAYGVLEDDFASVVAGAWKTYPIPLYALLILIAGWSLARGLRVTWKPEAMLAPQHPHHTASETERQLNLQLSAHVLATVGLLSWSLSPTPQRLADELPQSRFVRQVPLNGVEQLAAAVWLRLTEEPMSVAARLAYLGHRDHALRDFAGIELPDDPVRSTLELLPPQAMEPQPTLAAPPHVVLVVMESFATHLLRWQSRDFDLLGELAPYWERGWLFDRFLPSDNGSAGSILSLATNLPYRPGTKQLSQSEYGVLALPTSSARLFAAAGYETRFLYGGPLNWRKLGDYLSLQGFDEVAGQSAILAESGLKTELASSDWGAFDEHLFAAAARRLQTATRPQFLVLFTTTNHPPYELPQDVAQLSLTPPAELLVRLKELNPVQLKQFRTYQYACDQFGKFLGGLAAAELLERTIIAATGDHTVGVGLSFAGSELLYERAVPFFVLAPPPLAAQFRPDLGRPGSHKDVIPTLAHLAGVVTAGYRGIGQSLLDESADPFGYNPDGLSLSQEAVVIEFEGGYGTLVWTDSTGVLLRPAEDTPTHAALLRRTRAALALTDWILHDAELGKR